MASCLSRSVGLPPLFSVSGKSSVSGEKSVPRRTLSAAEMQTGEGNGSGLGGFEDVWRIIQAKTEESSAPAPAPEPEGVWGTILSEKIGGDDVAEVPYVHPLKKRSASSLSERSLEICTESLGSETGADEFCFSDEKEAKNDVVGEEEILTVEPRQQGVVEKEENRTRGNFGNHDVAVGPTKGKYNTSLPPPLPSLGNGSNVQMRCHRRDGRLVVEAVAVVSRNCFKAERQDGRLLLTFSDTTPPPSEVDTSPEFDVEEDSEDQQAAPVHHVDYKFLCLTRTSPQAATWTHRLNKVVPTPRGNDDVANSIPNSKTVMVHPATAAGAVNQYTYGWRSVSVPRGAEIGQGLTKGGGYNGQFQQGRPLSYRPNTRRCIATS